jgi:hypothetical protein
MKVQRNAVPIVIIFLLWRQYSEFLEKVRLTAISFAEVLCKGN